MIICPKCNAGNQDNTILCKECGVTIVTTAIDGNAYVEKMEAERVRKERINKILRYISLSIIGLIYIFFYIKVIIKGQFGLGTAILVLFLGPAYVAINHPELMFYLRLMFIIYNYEDAVPSDLYILSTKLGGYLMAIMGLVMMIILAFE